MHTYTPSGALHLSEISNAQMNASGENHMVYRTLSKNATKILLNVIFARHSIIVLKRAKIPLKCITFSWSLPL